MTALAAEVLCNRILLAFHLLLFKSGCIAFAHLRCNSRSLRISALSKNYCGKCGSVFDAYFPKDMIKVIFHSSF